MLAQTIILTGVVFHHPDVRFSRAKPGDTAITIGADDRLTVQVKTDDGNYDLALTGVPLSLRQLHGTNADAALPHLLAALLAGMQGEQLPVKQVGGKPSYRLPTITGFRAEPLALYLAMLDSLLSPKGLN